MPLDWQWADAYLKGGRKKYERPLYDRGLRIWKSNKWDPDSDIHIGWTWNGYQSFVIYHKDGSTTIQAQQPSAVRWQPLFGYSVRFTIQRYAGVHNVFQRNFKHYIIENDFRITPAKIQGCRQCSQTGLQDVWCYPDVCYDATVSADGKYTCDSHPDIDPAKLTNMYSRWHRIPCEHGLDDGHTIKNGTTCCYCNGTKKRDYGSKPERMLWDGSPLRLRDGKVIKKAASLLERMVADYVEPIA
jgi:hypothetical protein